MKNITGKEAKKDKETTRVDKTSSSVAEICLKKFEIHNVVLSQQQISSDYGTLILFI